VRCVGDGDTQGRPLKLSAPQTKIAPFAPIIALGCDSTLLSTGMGSSMPGTSFVGSCSASCDMSPVTVAGSSIYTSGSGICKAAVHAGVMGSEGGQVMVTVGFGQKSYVGSTAGSVTSEGHGADKRSVVIARPTSKVLGRVAIVPSLVNAGSSTFGSA